MGGLNESRIVFCDNRDGMVVIGMRMLCREGWIGLLEIDLISVSLFGHGVGDVVFFGFIFLVIGV